MRGASRQRGGDPRQRRRTGDCYLAGMSVRPVLSLSSVLSLILCSCGGGGPGAAEGGPVPPNGLTYSVNPAIYTVGASISPNTPSSGGGAVDSYSVSPQLPAGLGLNASTGVISGTPGAASATATYTVTAANRAGSTTVGLVIAVNVATVPPNELTYSANPAVYTVGVPISPNTPSSTGGPVESYSISPALPAGLSMDSSTGAISGTPSAGSTSANYTVTATNSAGSTTIDVNITVNAATLPPSGLAYSVDPRRLHRGSSHLAKHAEQCRRPGRVVFHLPGAAGGTEPGRFDRRDLQGPRARCPPPRSTR